VGVAEATHGALFRFHSRGREDFGKSHSVIMPHPINAGRRLRASPDRCFRVDLVA
jgi:hypothetical protein